MTVTPDSINVMVAREFPSSSADGIRCVEIGDGWAMARWPFDGARLRPGAYIPGPVMFALADSALWYATFTKIGIEPMAVTSEMSIRYLRPAQGGDLWARATINSVSARRIVGTIELWVDGAPERLVAVAQGSYARPAST
jgi:uncharacterized protein (TIGR00369 family)